MLAADERTIHRRSATYRSVRSQQKPALGTPKEVRLRPVLRFLQALLGYVAVGGGGVTTFLILAPLFGYFPYSDRPGAGWYPPASHYISEYAVGRLGWVMVTCFLAIGIGCLMLALGSSSIGLASRAGQAGIIGLVILSLTSLVAAGFPMDSDDRPTTLVGRIHSINFLITSRKRSIGAPAGLCRGMSFWRPLKRHAPAFNGGLAVR